MRPINQDRFLSRIKAALNRKTAILPHPAVRPPRGNTRSTRDSHHALTAQPSIEELDHLIEQLSMEAEAINLAVNIFDKLDQTADAVARLIAAKAMENQIPTRVAAWHHPLITGLHLEPRLASHHISIRYAPDNGNADRIDRPMGIRSEDKQPFRKYTANAHIGMTSADFCIAETASIVMKTRVGHPRAVSLLPPIHIAVIHARQIVADCRTLYARLTSDPNHVEEGLTNCMTMITGPSRTRDIEGVMVFGAHGPCEVHLMIIRGEKECNDS